MIYRTKNKKGFTLVELMVVSSIIALLASVVLGSLGNAKAKARDTERVQEMKNLQTALELYRLENGYPIPGDGLAYTTGTNDNSLSQVMIGLVTEGFLSEIPTPPKGGFINEDYTYQTENDSGNDFICQGKSLSSGDIPYIFYFYLELPQNLPKLYNGINEVPNTYCLTV
jgi:type II secretion system protein G